MDKTIGVLGGMGPQATVDFFQKIINLTPAQSDQEHIHIIIDNDPKTLDRTNYILGKGESPLNSLIYRAIKLEMAGADFLVMPCNTAHYFYDEIVRFIKIPFINMIEEVAKEIHRKYGSHTSVGLLATLGTYEGGIYERVLKEYDIKLVVPNDKGKKAVYDLIYMIKKDLKSAKTSDVCEVIEWMKEQGVSTIILGCTELPLVEKFLPSDVDYCDATMVLAKKAVELAKGIKL